MNCCRKEGCFSRKGIPPLWMQVSVIAVSLLTLLFLGCAPDSRTGQDETHVDDEASNQATSSDFNEEMPEDPSYSSDEFNYLNGLFRLSPDGSSAYPIENLNEITWADVVEGFSEDFRYRMFSSYSEDSELVTIDRSKGEQLVVMGEASEYCADGSEKVELVVEYGYWSGEGEGGTSGCFLDEVNGVSIEDAGSEEINAAVSGSGIEYIAADTIGFFASPDKNAKVSWGQYQGTDFAEGTRSLNTRFF